MSRRAALLAMVLAVSMAADADDPPGLVDVTEAAGLHWLHSIGDDEMSNIVESTGAGCAFLDYDGDGDLDLYLVNGAFEPSFSHPRGRSLAGRLTNALYRNDGDGTFTDVTDASGAGDDGYGMAVVAADYDNDGDTDLFITNYGRDTLLRNEGDGTFCDATEAAGVDDDRFTVGATFLDLDRDGWLDLFVGGYLEFDPGYRNYYAADGFPGPLSYPGERDSLYRNRGDGTFEDVTEAAGLAKARGRAMGVGAGDLDGDGFEDLFVANDAMENYFYRNLGDGRFEEIALVAGVAFGQNGEATSAMGPEIGDLDRDGLMDVLVPDMGYGCLYRNTGRGYFEEASARSGLAAVLGQYTSWSGNLVDLDNDGWLEVFIANGDPHHLEPEEDTVLENRDGTRLEDVSASLGADFQAKLVSRGAAVGDFDDDGDPDLLVLALNDRARLLRNDLGGAGHWLQLDLVGTLSNRDGIGARVWAGIGGAVLVRDVRSASGYLSQSEPWVHLGLGEATAVDWIEIRWPSGHWQRLENVSVDQRLVVTEPGPERPAPPEVLRDDTDDEPAPGPIATGTRPHGDDR